MLNLLPPSVIHVLKSRPCALSCISFQRDVNPSVYCRRQRRTLRQTSTNHSSVTMSSPDGPFSVKIELSSIRCFSFKPLHLSVTSLRTNHLRAVPYCTASIHLSVCLGIRLIYNTTLSSRTLLSNLPIKIPVLLLPVSSGEGRVARQLSPFSPLPSFRWRR